MSDEREGQPAGPGVRRILYAGPNALEASPVTRTILFACVAIFAGEVLAARSMHALAGVPMFVELAFGANTPTLTLEEGHIERLVTACFVHNSLMHVLLNMYTLRQVGPLVEPTVGSGRYSVLFVLTGIAGSLASAFTGELTGHKVVSVGASGAICGVMGAAVVVGARVEGWKSGIAWQIGFWLAVNLALGASVQGIDNAAHVGGLASGCVIAMLWRRGVRYSARATATMVGTASALCVASGLVLAWRERKDPYAALDWDARAAIAQDAFLNGDCATAREALAAARALKTRPTDQRGLEKAVDEKCPP